jgi:hypothetical protein
VTLPLAFGEEDGAPVAAAPAPQREGAAVRSDEARADPPAAAVDAMGALQQDLVDAGFENVRVGVDSDTLAVEYENDVYARAEVDALGVVLGHVAWRAPDGLARFAVAMERTQVPLVEVSGSLPALRAWFGRAGPAPAASLAESLALRWHPRRRAAAWWSEAPARGSALRPQLLLGPGLRTYIATEISVLEYVLSARPEARVPLWAGSMVYARWDVPFAWSDAFGDQGPLRLRRPGARLDHALLYQALPLAPGLTLLAGGGVYRATSAGALGELAWTPGAGELALSVRGAYTREVEGRRSGDLHQSLVASARYRFAPLDLVAKVSAGRFYENDRGAEVELTRFFGDTSVGVFYARADVPILGVRVSLPLTPRREMAPGLLQIRGTPLWEYDLYTVVQRRTNDVLTGIGVDPVSPWNVEDSYLDRSRLTLSALVRALPRARASFERWAARNEVVTDQ